jgi:hypothetical protein
MHQPLTETAKRGRRKMYEAGLYWIIRERAGSHGGWPPRDVNRVSGWSVVRMLADLTGRSPRDVAIDIIEHANIMERGATEDA